MRERNRQQCNSAPRIERLERRLLLAATPACIGPDGFGYTVCTYPLQPVGLTKGAAGVSSVLANVDDDTTPINLGANTFNFYGVPYTGANELFVSSNGLITFGAADADFVNTNLTADPSQAAIAPLWTDWTTTAGPDQEVLYKFDDTTGDGVPDRLIIEWHNVSDNNSTSTQPATFAAVLQLNTGSSPGDILFNYSNLDVGDPAVNNGADATAGIKAAGTQGPDRLLVSQNSGSGAFVATGMAVHISRRVAGTHVFYNNSAFDEHDPAINSSDDRAIAVDKVPLMAGSVATFANYTSYDKGINGVMIDLSGLTGTPTVSDFTFRAGNDNNPAGWLPAPPPSAIVPRPGAGAGASTRVEIVWPDGAIRNEWLQITINADAVTNLDVPYVFYFGNLVGESGSGPGQVTAADESAARADPHNFVSPANITNPHDYNRDGRVDATDQLIARRNLNASLAALNLTAAFAAVRAKRARARTAWLWPVLSLTRNAGRE